jgi:thiol-disulfide isomerase/thioredoxin
MEYWPGGRQTGSIPRAINPARFRSKKLIQRSYGARPIDTTWLTSQAMHPTDSAEDRNKRRPPWLLLAVIFVGAIGVTLFLGTRDGSSAPDSSFPDLGEIAENDPNLPSTNEAAPTFRLETLDGEVFDLADHIANDGRPVILNLWASWCPPCRSEMPSINVAAQRHPEVAFVGVAVQDDPQKAADFAEEIDITYTIAIDDGSVEEAYPVLGLPGTFFIAADGTIAKNHFGLVTIESLDDDIAELFGS